MPDELEQMLAQRAIPEPSSNLAERIIAAAEPKTAPRPRRSLWEAFADSFLLPRPAYIMGAVLLLGLSAGLSFEAIDQESANMVLASFMDAANIMETGDLL